MKKVLFFALLAMIAMVATPAYAVSIYVDSAPNVYTGGSGYDAWETAAFAGAATGTFVNMANGINPTNVGTTDFEIEDEVVYSFGSGGKRLHWVYYIANETVASLDGRIEVSLINTWDGVEDDFYLGYYGSTWLTPSKIYDYDIDGDGQIDGVVGNGGMAWWGAYQVNTQAALDADMDAWRQSSEIWDFRVKLDDEITNLECHRDAPVPEPATMALFGLGLVGLASRRRK